jgi:cobalt-zinc-cadmium efflux system membrane fusion protein
MPAAPAPPQALRVSGDGRSVAVVSPVSGRVTNAGANLGQFVAAETELFRVADPRRLQIMASVPPADAGRVREGDRVELTTTDGRKIEGRVRSSTGVVDPQSRTATVVVTDCWRQHARPGPARAPASSRAVEPPRAA